MLPIKAWTVFYADGSTFDSTQGSWAECPPFGVHAVVYFTPEGVADVSDGLDIYWFMGEEAGGQPWKMGLWTDGDTYWRLYDLAARSSSP
jgi:hypothetical protein